MQKYDEQLVIVEMESRLEKEIKNLKIKKWKLKACRSKIRVP